MALKKSDLYSSIWASCDELRGGMDASQYKDYVLFMLFIKYISDKYGKTEDFAAPVTIPKGASFDDMVALKGKADIGDCINKQVIQPLIEANDRLARSDFPDFNDPNKLGEGQAMVDRLTNLIGIFQNPDLDFSRNRAEHDDILGDAYEYLMRHFATQSGKSKGQFYTPAEVSRVIAKVIGISPENTKASTTAYDPTCGSGSLLLKVAAEAAKHITLEGQEMDVTTAGLARMNMILHDFPTANIMQGNTLASPKFKDGERLRTYDYVVANPPFSNKTWSIGLTPSKDPYQRFEWGVPPLKQGDYAFLLHIIRSMKSTGKGACILPHGVLFRGGAEATIREQLVRSGYLKGIIGLPPNLFYGTGIPACIVVLDKENAPARRGVFIIDASKGFMKDGPKNRLREQDIHRVVDTFTREVDVPRYARMVPLEEIAAPKNAFNLNLPRYIDSSEPEDLQDIDAHLRGGIPERDVDALGEYWDVMPGLRATLFESAGRPGYCQLRVPLADVKAAIFGHPEFIAFHASASRRFEEWRQASSACLTGFDRGAHPKQLIHDLAESLLAAFKATPLLDAYDVYQHLMDYWAETMQDDCYLISAVGWHAGAQPREIRQVKNKDGKLVWPETHEFTDVRRRLKSDLVPAAVLIDRYFAVERDAIACLESDLATIEQELDDVRTEQGGEDGLLSEVIEGDGEKQKIAARAIKARLKEVGTDADFAEERQALEEYDNLLTKQAKTKACLKSAQQDLEKKVGAQYPATTEPEIKSLVVGGKWMARLSADVQDELDRVSQTLTGRIRELAERYASPRPQLDAGVKATSTRVEQHLQQSVKQGILAGRTRLPGFSGEWEVKRLGDLGVFLKGSGVRKDEAQSGELPCVRYGEIYTHHDDYIRSFNSWISPEVAKTATRLKRGDLLFAGSGETKEEIGKCVAYLDDYEAYAGGDIVILRLYDANPMFMGYYCNTPTVNAQKASLGQGDAVVHISAAALSAITVAVPSLSEQAAIADVLADLDAELAALEMQLTKSRWLRQGMIQALLTERTQPASLGNRDA